MLGVNAGGCSYRGSSWRSGAATREFEAACAGTPLNASLPVHCHMDSLGSNNASHKGGHRNKGEYKYARHIGVLADQYENGIETHRRLLPHARTKTHCDKPKRPEVHTHCPVKFLSGKLNLYYSREQRPIRAGGCLEYLHRVALNNLSRHCRSRFA
jgi:hypothetical protein